MAVKQKLLISLMVLTVRADLQDQSLMIQTGHLQMGQKSPLEGSYDESDGPCLNSDGSDGLQDGGHTEAALQDCQTKCDSTSGCTGVEWYAAKWNDKTCYLMVGVLSKGAGKGSWRDAKCFVKLQTATTTTTTPAWGPLSYENEDQNNVAVKFIKDDDVGRIAACAHNATVSTDVTFRVRRDDSYSDSEVKFIRINGGYAETIRLKGGYSDRTDIVYDGKTLTCTGSQAQCQTLQEKQPTPALIISVDFKPRTGSAHNKQWSRNKFSISGSYYHADCADGYDESEGPCLNSDGSDGLQDGGHEEAALQDCKTKCDSTSGCTGVEWYAAKWNGKKCYLMVGVLAKGAGKGTWKDAKCFVKKATTPEPEPTPHQDFTASNTCEHYPFGVRGRTDISCPGHSSNRRRNCLCPCFKGKFGTGGDGSHRRRCGVDGNGGACPSKTFNDGTSDECQSCSGLVNAYKTSCEPLCPAGYFSIEQNLDGTGKVWTKPHPDSSRSLQQCADICSQRDGCTSFEYANGPSENGACGTYTGGSSNIKADEKRKREESNWYSCTKV